RTRSADCGVRRHVAARRRLHRLRAGRIDPHRQPGRERAPHLRRAGAVLVRRLERGGTQRTRRARSGGAVALRPLLRLRAGRDRQPGRGVLPRLRRALPVPRAACAGGAELAGRLVIRPLALLVAQALAVASILASLLVLAGRHPLRVDLTPDGNLTLSPHTREVLSRLREPVTATAFASGQEQG